MIAISRKTTALTREIHDFVSGSVEADLKIKGFPNQRGGIQANLIAVDEVHERSHSFHINTAENTRFSFRRQHKINKRHNLS